MVKLLLFPLVTLLVAACAKPRLPVYVTDEAFTEYISSFEQIYGIKVNVGIVFNDSLVKDKHFAGVCHSYSVNNIHNWIEIDTDNWNYSNIYGRQQLIFHELGHCVMGLQHDTRIGNIGIYTNIPLSIMYPIYFGNNTYYNIYNSYYINELGSNYGF